MLSALLLGILISFITAIPVAGPVSAIVFAYGMRSRYSQGRRVAFGAGLAEALYTFVAFWSFNHFLINIKMINQISNTLVAFLLCVLGFYFFFSKKMRHQQEAGTSVSHLKKVKAFAFGFSVSIVNPTLIATWTAVVAMIHSLKIFEFSILNFAGFSLGVWLGISFWFVLMLALLKKYKNHLNPKVIDYGLKCIGILLFILAGISYVKI